MFLQQVDFNSCPWNIALGLRSFKGNSELLKQVIRDQNHADGRPRFEVRKLRGSEWIFATESVRRYSCQERIWGLSLGVSCQLSCGVLEFEAK